MVMPEDSIGEVVEVTVIADVLTDVIIILGDGDVVVVNNFVAVVFRFDNQTC
ncbi:14870_t:CDS:2 [Entrophospora sp. SA101]|nr:14870_t:CDS:2 [Entrophospora sp. SA101]